MSADPEPVVTPAAAQPPKPSLLARLAPYRKAVTSLVGVGLTWASLYFGSNPADAKWLSIAVGAAAALGVYAVPNSPKP